MTQILSFPTPKPCRFTEITTTQSVGGECSPPKSCQSMYQTASFVTPDYPKRQTLCTSSPLEGPSIPDGVPNTKEVSTMDNGDIPTRAAPLIEPYPVNSAARYSGPPPSIPLISSTAKPAKHCDLKAGGLRLNKFVRRLHEMLKSERNSSVVEWRRGLLVLYSTDTFAKKLLPKYFNTRNFKTFRRQLNYYGFVHVRSFSTTGSSTTALWVNRDLAKEETDDISSVLKLRRVEPCEASRTVEGRRYRKKLAIHAVEEDIGVYTKSLQVNQIRAMALRDEDKLLRHMTVPSLKPRQPPRPTKIARPRVPFFPNNDGDSANKYYKDAAATISEDIASTSAANVLLMLRSSFNY